MIMVKYYVVYVEVPSGHPGVDEVWEPICGTIQDAYETVRKMRNYAILDILEAR